MYQKKWKPLICLLLAGCLMAGCGDGNKEGKGTASVQTSESEQDGGTSESSEEVSEKPDGTESPEENGGEKSEKSQTEEAATPKPSATPKVYVEKSRYEEGGEIYSDNIRTMTALRLKEYSRIEQNGYTDEPAKGKRYLVLFLEIENHSSETLYISPSYLSARLDGVPIEHTFLYNAPEGYESIFQNIEAGESRKGFIVWEVPEGWKKMSVTYKEFEMMEGKRLKLSFTRKDLKKSKKKNK